MEAIPAFTEFPATIIMLMVLGPFLESRSELGDEDTKDDLEFSQYLLVCEITKEGLTDILALDISSAQGSQPTSRAQSIHGDEIIQHSQPVTPLLIPPSGENQSLPTPSLQNGENRGNRVGALSIQEEEERRMEEEDKRKAAHLANVTAHFHPTGASGQRHPASFPPSHLPNGPITTGGTGAGVQMPLQSVMGQGGERRGEKRDEAPDESGGSRDQTVHSVMHPYQSDPAILQNTVNANVTRTSRI